MSTTMTVEEAVASFATNAFLNPADPELAHATADAILLACADPAVRDAYESLVVRCAWWACA